MSRQRYTHDTATHNRRAAAEVVPWLVQRFHPRTVVDLGCGLGSWLAVFAEHGCEVLGLDSEDVPQGLLEIPRECFRVVDFEEETLIQGRFDLALCLELAEHLSECAGRRLVQGLLTSVADVVIFSAAVPGQGGDNHVNEQWPAYWQDVFTCSGFVLEDAIRWRFWDNDQVDWWYRQNMFIARRQEGAGEAVRAIVHPCLLAKKVRQIEDFYEGKVSPRTGAIVFFRALLNAFRSLGRGSEKGLTSGR